MKASWRPAYDVESRQPAFITAGGPAMGQIPYGRQKYLWGNIPALDVLNINHNEAADNTADHHLLFAGTLSVL